MRLKGDERIATICKVQNEEPDDESADGDTQSNATAEQVNMLSDDENQ